MTRRRAIGALVPALAAWMHWFLAAGLALGLPAPAAAATAVADCTQLGDRLARVRCEGRLRVGVRTDYPRFGSLHAGQRSGYEVELARAIGASLGVAIEFVTVTPATRLSALGEDRVDLVLATFGHTLLRDGQAWFVTPHHYLSRTVLVGRAGQPAPETLRGRTVCVTVGNATNAELAMQDARLMLFADPAHLIDELQRGGCALAAQDDSVLHPLLQPGPGGAAAFELQRVLAFLPWGLALRREDGNAALAHELGALLRRLHADGSLVRLARESGIDERWLLAQQQRWSTAPCAAMPAAPECLDPPHDDRLPATPVAGAVDRAEAWLAREFGWRINLAMLKTQVAWSLFVQGLLVSLALVAGAVLATWLMGCALAAGLGSRRRRWRWPLLGLLWVAQAAPMVLLMSSAGIVLAGLGAGSLAAALAMAVLVLGLFNGSHAGQAIAEARAALRAEGRPAGLVAALVRARAQVSSFAVNAARGSPAASLIGVPELLAAQTDIASISAERVTTFTLLLLVYILLVSGVVAAGRAWQRWLAAWGESRGLR